MEGRRWRCCAVLVCLCFVVGVVGAVSGTHVRMQSSAPQMGGADSSSYACSKVYTLPTSKDQCTYVQESCIDTLNDAFSTKLLAVYFCNPPVIKVLVLVAAVFLLLGLFKGIGLTAERYFSVILSQISQDLNLPPRLAGCTLLALGNGAPDLSSSIEAIQHGHDDLALGSLVGSVMFIGCVVAGRIISLSGRAGSKELRCNAAQVRDVLALAVAVACVGGIAFVGTRDMTMGGVSLLLSLYVGYVVLVLVADLTRRTYGIEWTGLIGLFRGAEGGALPRAQRFSDRLRTALLPHRTRRSDDDVDVSPRSDQSDDRAISNTGSSSEVELVESPRDLSPRRTTWAPGVRGERRDSRIDVSSSLTSAISTMLTSPFESIQEGDGAFGAFEQVARATTEQPIGREHHRGREHGHRRPDEDTNRAPHIRPKYSQMTTTEYRARAFAAMSDVRSFHRAAPLPLDEAMSILDLEDMIEAMVDREECAPTGHGEGPFDVEQREFGRPNSMSYTTTVFEANDHGVDQGNRTHASVSMVRHTLEFFARLGEIFVVPLAYLLKSTIPVVANVGNRDDLHDSSSTTESGDFAWFVPSAAFSPLFATVYFSGGIFSTGVLPAGLAAVIGAILATCAWKATKHPQVLDRVPLAPLIGIYGFVMSALWIGLIAEELVGIIHVFGVISHIKPSILGVTVLAWGNSLTDLMANIAIAMTAEGGVSMAMTACFAGPLFNLLMGLGVGFLMYFSTTGLSERVITFDLVSAIGCVFALANCFGLIAMALWHRSSLPSYVGWLMMAWYGIYMCLVVGVSLLC